MSFPMSHHQGRASSLTFPKGVQIPKFVVFAEISTKNH